MLDHAKPDASTYEEVSLVINGATIHFWTNRNTEKPTIFLLHGAAMDHNMFDAQLDALSDYNVIAWDARGHGMSRPAMGALGLGELAQDCIEILRHQKIKSAVLVGQSEGGMVAQEVYRLEPSMVKAIVAIGASPIMLPYSKYDIWLLKFSTNIIKIWPYRNFMTALAKKTAIKKGVQDYALCAVKNISKTDFLSIWDGVTGSISHEGISGMHITVPLLLTYGDKDTTGTVAKNNVRWKMYEPHADLIVIPCAGHNANQDNAQYFNKVLKEFLGRIFIT